jgi:hypothetical protein
MNQHVINADITGILREVMATLTALTRFAELLQQRLEKIEREVADLKAGGDILHRIYGRGRIALRLSVSSQICKIQTKSHQKMHSPQEFERVRQSWRASFCPNLPVVSWDVCWEGRSIAIDGSPLSNGSG